MCVSSSRSTPKASAAAVSTTPRSTACCCTRPRPMIRYTAKQTIGTTAPAVSASRNVRSEARGSDDNVMLASDLPLAGERARQAYHADADMIVRFWGTRGSLAKPGPSTLRYGGNTSCVEVRTAGGTLIILDCGTGAHALGHALVA